MEYKKVTILFIILLISVLSLSGLLISLNMNDNVPLGVLKALGGVKTETDLKTALDYLVTGNNRVIVSIENNNTCFKVRPTYNGTHYLLKIKEYKSKTGNCIGLLKDQTEVVVDKGINILGGKSCLCYGEYLLEWKKDGLRIRKG